MFESKVDMRSRKKMTDFLLNHFRYDTMHSWNRCTSYANNMKITHLSLPRETSDKLWDMLDANIDGLRYSWEKLINNFEKETGYTAGWNGRSDGYLVMYDFEWKPTEHKSYCTSCGQRNFKSTRENGCVCGVCRRETRVDYATPPMRKCVYPGRSIDDFNEEDFAEYDLDWLKERVRLVQRFDKLCSDIIAEAVRYTENFDVVDKKYTVVKTGKILKKKGAVV